MKKLTILLFSIFISFSSYGGLGGMSVLDMSQGASNSLAKAFLDPIMKSQGYQSEESRILDIMKRVDPFDLYSITDGYIKILAINPAAAAEYLKILMPETYPEGCPCPYSIASDGSRCGARSAYSRPGGYQPKCY